MILNQYSVITVMTMIIRIKKSDINILLALIFALLSCVSYMISTMIPTTLWKIMNYFCLGCTDGLCLIYVFSHIQRKTLYRKLTALVILFVIYEYYVSFSTKSFVFPNAIGDLLTWPLLLITMYYYARGTKNPIGFRRIIFYFSIFIYLVSIPCISLRSGTSVFSVYYCISILPLIYLFSSKRTSIMCSLISAILIILTSKRASFLILVLGIGLCYLVLIHNEKSSRKRIIRTTVCILIAIFAVIFIQYAMDNLDIPILNRLSSISTDGGSGRVDIWRYLIKKFQASSTTEKVFGHGFHSVLYKVKPLGHARFAHNSYLETLYDYGIVGAAMLIAISIGLVVATLKMTLRKSKYAPVMVFTVVEMMILSMVSYFYEQSVIIVPISIVWGICLGLHEREEAMNINNRNRVVDQNSWR